MEHSWTVHHLSPYLFWDTDRNNLDFERSKVQIISQVIEYGMMEDWNIIRQVYSDQTIREVVTNLRSMDPVTLSFMAFYLGIDKSEFRCYKQKQSVPDFWSS